MIISSSATQPIIMQSQDSFEKTFECLPFSQHEYYEIIDTVHGASLSRTFIVHEHAAIDIFISILHVTSTVKITIKHLGSHGQSQTKILTMLKNDNTVDCYYSCEQSGQHTNARLHHASLVTEQASLLFNGKMRITPTASSAQAEQSSAVVLSGAHARVSTTPILEIERHDVSCKHATSIGTVNQEQLIYAASRGISAEMIKTLITQSFLYDFLKKHCGNAPTAEYIKERLFKGLT